MIWDSTGVSSWRGFSLENAPEFELWLEGERARWRRVFGELCERLSRLEGEEGLIAEAIGTARLWVRQAPLEETAHRRLMELLSGAGESERALLVYEGFRNTLSRALGMSPLRRCSSCPLGCRRSRRGLLWVRAVYTLQLLLRFRCWRCRWLAARKSLVRSSQSIKRRAWAKRASCPSWGRRG